MKPASTFFLVTLLWTASASPASTAPLFPAPEARRQSEQRENQVWIGQIRAFAVTQSPDVRAALETIVSDAEAMAQLDAHKAHDALKATLAKIERARAQPDGAVARERLDARVGNFGVVEAGKLYRGAQPSPTGLRWLRQQGVQRILVLREPGVEETNYPGWTRAQYLADIRALGMTPVELNIRDRTIPTPTQLEQFLRAVEADPSPAFVHCSAGVGRTGILAGIYARRHGCSAAEALEFSKQFQMDPSSVPDHALQASLIANYPLGREDVPLEVGWADGAGSASPLRQALQSGRGWPAPDSVRLDAQNPSAAVQALATALREGTFVRVEFRSPTEVSYFASMARALPVGQKMGSVSFAPLGGTLDLAELQRARKLLGDVPFEVRAAGLKLEDLTPERIESVIGAVQGNAEIVDFNLEEGVNPPESVVRRLAAAGLACTIRLGNDREKSEWDALGVAYVTR